MSEQEPRYASKEEAAELGFFPDDIPPDDTQHHPKDSIEVYGSMPVVVELAVFKKKSHTPLTISVGGVKTYLDEVIRQIAYKLSQNKKGEIEATPATPEIRGGGIAPIDPNAIDPITSTEINKTHKKSSHRRLDLIK